MVCLLSNPIYTAYGYARTYAVGYLTSTKIMFIKMVMARYNKAMTERAIARAERWGKAVDLLGGICVECGSIKALHFDHKDNDRVDVRHTISQMIEGSWARVVEELKKCQLLCRWCHGKKTQKDNGHNQGIVHGTASAYNNSKCRCTDCRQAWSKYKSQHRPSRARHKRKIGVL